MAQRPRVLIVDVDGTIALMGKGLPDRRGPYDWDRVGEDDPNAPVIELVKILRSHVDRVIFLSGRDEACRTQTEWWLSHHVGAAFDEPLYMRGRKDNRGDDEVKREIYERDIVPHYDVAWVIDDRDRVVAMWRTLGLTVLQVAPGDF